MNMTININVRLVVRILSCFALGLLFAGVISHSLTYDFNWSPELNRWFNVNKEKNFPTAFSVGQLLFCSFLLLVIAVYKHTQQDRFMRYWYGLSLLLSALATDELLVLHERMSGVIQQILPVGGIFHYAWIIAGMVFLSLVAFVYWRFLMHLPRVYRRGFVISAMVFVLGAIGMEMISGYYMDSYQQWNPNIWLGLTTVEEGLEMFGVIIFIHTLLNYIQEFVGQVTFCMAPSTKESQRKSAIKRTAMASISKPKMR